jgi:hypothetical protein
MPDLQTEEFRIIRHQITNTAKIRFEKKAGMSENGE